MSTRTPPASALRAREVDRSDLARRREVKYVFRDPDVATLRHLLRRTCRPIAYAGPVSTVRSVYFDDPPMSAARKNLDGVGLREKTRVRWYDRPLAGERAFLEVKWRRHRETGKHRLELAGDEPIAELSYRALLTELRRVAPDRFQHRLAHDTDPVVLVQYRREHFALREGGARLTLDYDLCFFPQQGTSRPRLRFGERLADVAIVEVKADAGAGVALPRALGGLGARVSRFSKYVVGCQRLGILAEE